MVQINTHYQKLQAGYLFPEIGKRTRAFQAANPDAKVIPLGIGDVVLPLAEPIASAMRAGIDELQHRETFKGYGPGEGYEFLRSAIADHYRSQGADVSPDEIFVSDGSKCDNGNIQEIFSLDNIVAVTDPVYPVYVDTNVMAGRTGGAIESGRYAGLVYLPMTAENNFDPALPEQHVDLVYLCSPNNPTGAVLSRELLRKWVDYARETGAIILFDAAYEAYISESDTVHSIFEIEGAREVAIEFRSFSKSAGFTGVRCGYTVVPRALQASDGAGGMVDVRSLWQRRQGTKFNGVSYPVQKGAAAVFSKEGAEAVRQQVDYYMENARIIRNGLTESGLTVYGGVNAPYIWLKTPGGLTSWEFFDELLSKANVVGTPGSGFGASGEGYFRLSAFGYRENIAEAVARIKTLVQ